jgi:hypothetical protein
MAWQLQGAAHGMGNGRAEDRTQTSHRRSGRPRGAVENGPADVGRWQHAFGCSVQVLLIAEPTRSRAPSDEVLRFCAWAASEAKLELLPRDVVACSPADFLPHFETITAIEPDLVVCPGSPDLSAAIGAIPVHGVWSRVASLNVSLLLSRGHAAMHRVLVVTDGTPRTLPVLQTAFELAEYFNVQLSHLDTLRVPALWGLRRELERKGTGASEGSQKYLRVVRGLVAAVNRAQHNVRPDVLLMGASVFHGGGTASALSSTLLPCSVLIVPL